ncbi:cytochrome c [Sphingomonas laterariae]|uniref:Cytochrome c n=1 Tax=Edaphosphingomonas laterariae TaxID=861865 RepID=A0A239H3Q4_9SPHN|nr:cytochrome c family protein [Sphingomonas laterariae]SNS76029.1 cytochrome c [Sphingomonas laterariae]
MNRWRKSHVLAGLSLAIAAAWGSGMFANRLFQPVYPGQPAYGPADVSDPVDLATLQRDWPAGLDSRAAKARLAGYMTSVERGTAPMPAIAAESARPAAAPVDLGTLLAAASGEKGKATARVCLTCHTFEQGGPNRTGPNLWGVVGRDIGSHAGFAYSPALTVQPGSWTYAQLDAYLTSPARSIPGNRMAFAGIRNPADRAGLLAYLGSLSPSPAPFPPPKAIAAGGESGVTGR